MRTMRKGVECVPQGLYHKTVEVIPADNGYVLTTQRDVTKKKGGGLFEFPCGSCFSGEDYAAAARRELFEETGLIADELIRVQKAIMPGIFRMTYLAFIPGLLTKQIILQPGETQAYRFVTLDEWEEMIVRGQFYPRRIETYSALVYSVLHDKVSVPDGQAQITQPQQKTHPLHKRESL